MEQDLVVSTECHSCGHYAYGFALGELMAEEGWRAYRYGPQPKLFGGGDLTLFVMCGECVKKYKDKEINARAPQI